MNGRKSAFTLIEVLIAVVLTGLIASLAFVPVIVAVRQLTETEEAYMDGIALRRTALFMAQDVASGLRLASTALVIIDRSSMNKDRGVLIVASAAPAKQNMAAGSVVYKVLEKGIFEDRIHGLYRWILPGVLPEEIDPDKLDDDKGQLILPYVTGLKIAAWEPPDWSSEYSGKLPQGVQITLSREEETVEYVFNLPQ